MKRTLLFLLTLGLAANAKAQLWNGDPLPPDWNGDYSVDNYFVPDGSGLSEFDNDTGYNFSRALVGTVPMGIEEANGWVDASSFALTLKDDDVVTMTFLGNTAGWLNDFGVNRGNTNVSGGTAYTVWHSIMGGSPVFGSQTSFVQGADDPETIDFWLNSNEASNGGTYSIFYPEASDPGNTGEPTYPYSARGKVFNVWDDGAGMNRTVLVVGIEDWRNFDADFSDMFFAIEIGDRLGQPQFPVPEPSTYGLFGAAILLGLVVIRGARRRSHP